MPQNVEYTESDLAQLIKGLEAEFSNKFSEAGILSKSEEGEKSEKEPHKEESHKDEHKDEHKEEDHKEPHEEHEPSHEEHSDDDDHGYDDEDMEHMNSMYSSMSKGELRAHHDAVKRALDALSGHAGGPTGDPKGSPGEKDIGHDPEPLKNIQKAEDDSNFIEKFPPKGSPGAKSQASKDSDNLHDAMKKGENDRTRESGGNIYKTAGPKGSPGAQSPASKDQGNLSDMEKSENLMKSELEAKDAEIADLKKSMENVQEFLTKIVSKMTPAPKGKAITEIGALNKSEDMGSGQVELSKSEITARLLAKTQDPNLSVQDRHAINAYYLNGANVSTISHLLN